MTERLSAGTPPPPEAAALGKFAEIPVSLYSGVPSITIPIYDVQLRGLTLPISLNYHAGGVRVSEIASSVGLGWALQAGGSISSTVLGKDDFAPTGYANGAWPVPHDRPLSPLYTSNDYLYCMRATGTSPAGTPAYVYTSSFDTQPDLYYYSMCGRSGKFFHTQEGKAHPVPYEPVAIERGNGYTIVDEKGNQFFFQKQEIATTYIIRYGGHSSPQDDYAPRSTVFYLSRVETPTHESITLSYDTLTYGYNSLGSYTRYRTSGSTLGCADKVETHTENLTRVQGLRLSAIRSSRGDFVEFRYSSCDRTDLPRTKALKQILVHKGSTIQRFDLGFGYFNIPEARSDCDRATFVEGPPKCRLKLASVTESGKPSYVIKYREDLPFPSRLSQAQDHWGYFNNQTGTLLPKDLSKGFYTGGDREPHVEMMQTGIIQSLRYPTGGWTEYEFEPNTYRHAAGTTSYEIKQQPISIFAGRDSDLTPGPNDRKDTTITFTVPHNIQPYSTQAILRTGCGFRTPQVTPQFRVELQGPDNFRRTFGGTTDPKVDFTEKLELAPGEYTLTATTYGYCPDDYFRLMWTEVVTKQTPDTTRLAGGLRIREIRSFASKNDPEPLRQYYRYSPLQDSTQSSGRIQSLPSYSYYTTENRYSNLNQTAVEGECRYIAQSSNSIEPLGNIQGGNVAYTSVLVFKDKTGEHGLTHHTFSWKEDEAPYGHGFPFTPATSFDWQRGLPLQVTQYSRKTGAAVYQPLARTVSHYYHNYTPPGRGQCEDCSNFTLPNRPNETHAVGLNIVILRPEFFLPGARIPTVVPSEFVIQSFKYLSTWSYLYQKDEYAYNPSDSTKYRVVRTFYKYDNPTHAQLTRTQTLTSAGDTLTLQQRYALDYDTAAASSAVAFGLTTLARRHILTNIVEQQQWLTKQGSNYLLGGRIAQYRGILPTHDFVLQPASPIPAAQFTASAISDGSFLQDSRYRPTLGYELFDGLGNILQARHYRAGPQSFLWGYSATQPIARALNAEYNQLAYTSFEPNCPSRWRHPLTNPTPGGHTGQQCYPLLSPVACDSLPAGEYQFSCWATAKPDIYLNSLIVPNAVSPVGPLDPSGFQQYSGILKMMAERNRVAVSGTPTTRLDELRLHPVGSQLTTYTHDPLTGMTSQTDVNGRTASYEYDALGRLQRVRDEQGNILTQQEYHYARP
ncbi:RHS repeat protein [Hymenobacter chitinivorans]|uniref:YD repeat-containing protein n=1 Tax=Hymenobacter chitinivorans DSM 11115 TaxID=1121954 RepID=A0A2M9ARX5_9BACT|nr:RHS repeat domain-containing protein [Hymenobacter chitinivorans]PJJ48430.1 YD repeat-containing protein [Hymenobacter chitinivorans DSM 11115]